jgi:cysteine desulfurase / selenocysteine lyase
MSTAVYLDYAATSAIRPPEVAVAVADYLGGVGATPGRAGHLRSREAGRMVLRCRRALAELFGVEGDPGRIVFQHNATHALNSALFGALSAGDLVVRTGYDHNSVRRPVAELVRRRGVRDRVLTGRPDGSSDLDELTELLRGDGRPARLLVLPHASNVTGAALPVREMADRAREAGALVLLDAAQSAGHLLLDVRELGVDLLAFTGHKGLLGPQGVGGLWIRDGVELPPLLFGGTGSRSEEAVMPESLPDRHEAGSLNAPGIAGLLAGVEWLARHGVTTLHAREMAHKARLIRALAGIPGLQLRSPAAPDGVALVTVTARGMHPSELARRLDAEHGVQARAGLHCAPEAHAALGTLETGALRLSIGWATTDDDITRAVDALAELTSQGAETG